MSARVAWALAILTGVLVAADIVLTAAFESLTSNHAFVIHGFPLVHAAVLGSAAMGALILSRYPRHIIGWLLSLVGLTSAISLVTETYGVWVLDHGGPGSRAMAGVSGWLSSLFGGQVAITLIAVLFLVAPNGQLMSRRWRVAIWIPALGTAFCTTALLTINPASYDITTLGSTVGRVGSFLFGVGFLLISVGLVVSLVAMLRRLRVSEGDEHRQLRFVAAAAGLLVAGVLLLFVVQLINGGEQTLLSTGLLFVAYAAMPLLIAIAVLRYRLYEIDVIINRAVVLAIGTVFAGIGYIVLVVGIGAAVGSTTGGFWVSLGATAVVALAFQPLRQGVVRLANRFAYGDRAVPYLALADFNRKLAETPSAAALLPAVAEAAGRAVGAARATATLALEGNQLSSSEWAPGGSDEDPQVQLEVLIRDGGVVLGGIAVIPRKGRALRASDVALLNDLADQASHAFRNIATESRLADQVAALDRTTRQLADSRRRIIEADDAARVRLEAAISREVLPRLTALPARLSEVRAMAGGNGAQSELDELVSETNGALESLRDITRGVFPTQLARVGLGAPLRTLLARNGLDGVLAMSPEAERRYSARVEAAVYFCCVEMLRRSAKPSRIDLQLAGDELLLEVEGVGLDEIDLQVIRDRVEAAGGSVLDDGVRRLSVRVPASSEVLRAASKGSVLGPLATKGS